MTDLRIEFKQNEYDEKEVEIGSFVGSDGKRKYVQLNTHDPDAKFMLSPFSFTGESTTIKYHGTEKLTLRILRDYFAKHIDPKGPYRTELKELVYMIDCEDTGDVSFSGRRGAVDLGCHRGRESFASSTSSLEARVAHIESYLESRF